MKSKVRRLKTKDGEGLKNLIRYYAEVFAQKELAVSYPTPLTDLTAIEEERSDCWKEISDLIDRLTSVKVSWSGKSQKSDSN